MAMPKGHKHTDEHRAKIAESMKAYWANKQRPSDELETIERSHKEDQVAILETLLNTPLTQLHVVRDPESAVSNHATEQPARWASLLNFLRGGK